MVTHAITPTGPSESSPPFPSPLAPGGWSEKHPEHPCSCWLGAAGGDLQGWAGMLSLLPSADLRSCLPSASCVLGPGMVLGLPFHSTQAVYLMTLG